jgi:hypothetical protein
LVEPPFELSAVRCNLHEEAHVLAGQELEDIDAAASDALIDALLHNIRPTARAC